MPTAPVAAGSLVAGYAVAAETGVRPLGGVVFLAGTAWCARTWSRRRGVPTAAALTAVQLAAFGASHLLARRLGAWGSVATVAAASGVAASLLGDRR